MKRSFSSKLTPEVAYLKPRGYQTQPTRMPMATGNPFHLTFSGIQSNAYQLEPKPPMDIQNLRLPRTHGKPKHYPQPMWRNLGPVPFTHSVHSYSEVSPNLIRENREPDANSVKRRPLNMVASNAIQPTLPLSNSVMPSVHNSSTRSDYYPVRSVRQMTTDSSSASTFRTVQASTVTSPGGILSAIPAASPYNPHGMNPLSRGENEKDATSTKRHVCCESPKQVTAAVPDHIVNAMPRDVHLVSHLPARLSRIYTPEEANENRSQKAHFPVHIVYVPPNASRVNATRPCRAADLNGQLYSAEVYNTWDVRQPVSVNASQPLKTSGKLQYRTCYAPSQVRASEGLMKVPIQHSYQSTFAGFCRPTGKETSALNNRIDSMNSVHQETPPSSKTSTIMVAPPRRPNYVAQAICQPLSAQSLMTSNLRFRSMNVPEESRNANPTFQEQGKSRGDPCSRVRPWIVPNHQPRNQNSGNGFKYGGPSSWNNNAPGYASPHITRGYQATLPRHPRVCDGLTIMKEPHCHISVDSKPPQAYRKQEEFKFAEAATRCREMVQSREYRMPCVDQEQQAKQLEKLTKFVVGVETKIHWNKIRNNSEISNRIKEQDMQVISVSNTHNSPADTTETHSNLSQSDSDDAFCMMRLERVYYSINATPSTHAQSSVVSQEQGSEPSEFDADFHRGNLTNPRGDTHQITANCEYGSEQSSPVATRNKSSKGSSLGMKVLKNVQVPDSRPVKRKANVSSTKRDEVCNAKRKKMEKNKSYVSPKGTVIPALAKVKKSVEILPMKELTAQLESGSKTFLEDLTCIAL